MRSKSSSLGFVNCCHIKRTAKTFSCCCPAALSLTTQPQLFLLLASVICSRCYISRTLYLFP